MPEIVSPQKNICSELACTGTDINSDDDIFMPVSAESQTETADETND